MADRSPPRLSKAAIQARYNRVRRIAGEFGFVGQVEYRHSYSRSGGAQYRPALLPDQDMLIVYAEAFDRDADPAEFSLEAIIAHERGHQILIRHSRIGSMVKVKISSVGEEVLSSIIGAIISPPGPDRDNLEHKAVFDLAIRGEQLTTATRLVTVLREVLGELL